MKFHTIFLACALTVSSLSFSAFSKESKFCSNALNTVCTDSKFKRVMSAIYLNGFKKEIAKDARNKTSKPNKKIQSGKAIVNEMYKLISNPKNVSMFKNHMLQAIDESNFEESIRIKFKSTINSVMIGNYSEFFESNDPRFEQLKNGIVSICGVDGMSINAFTQTIYDSNYVFFCPGFLIDLSRASNEQERLNSFFHMMSHELSHYIDMKLVGDKAYMPFLSCLSSNYSDQFKRTAIDEAYCNQETTSFAECNMQVTRSHANELIADQWAIKVLAIHVRTQGYSSTQTDLFLKNNFFNICETKTEGIHPTGNFRIEKLLRINPEISDYLTCNNSGIKSPACTFDGSINL